MITSTNHFSFTVSDLDKSLVFYNTVLGVDTVDVSYRPPEFSEAVTGIAGAFLKIGYIKTSNVNIELIQYQGLENNKAITTTSFVGSSHACFNVNNFDQFIDELKSAGVVVSSTKIAQVPDGPNKGKKVIYMKDPDGNNLEFLSNETYD